MLVEERLLFIQLPAFTVALGIIIPLAGEIQQV